MALSKVEANRSATEAIMRVIAVTMILAAYVAIHASSASAQSFEDRGSIIPNVQAEQRPQINKQIDPPSQPRTPTERPDPQIQSPIAARLTHHGSRSFKQLPWKDFVLFRSDSCSTEMRQPLTAFCLSARGCV